VGRPARVAAIRKARRYHVNRADRADRAHNAWMPTHTISATTASSPRMPSESDCVRCGLCLEHCPTYVELGLEAESPRGRIAIMRGLHAGRLRADDDTIGHLDRCLDCRACETACPSGVRYGALIERTRAELSARRFAATPDGAWQRLRAASGEGAAGWGNDATTTPRRGATWADRLRDYFLLRVVPDRRRLARWTAVARVAESLGIPFALNDAGLPRRFGLPPIPAVPAVPRCDALQSFYAAFPADGAPPVSRDAGASPSSREAGTVRPAASAASLFAGCATEVLTPQTNRAAIRMLRGEGCDVACPRAQVCCGAIHLHAGRIDQARALARQNIAAFARAPGEIVVTAAGCGAMLKHYGDLLAHVRGIARDAARFAARVRDVTEWWSAQARPARRDPAPPSGDPVQRLGGDTRSRRIVYHDACHLCHAQSIRLPPRAMLASVPGSHVVPLVESELCCGAAGAYSLTQPEMSARLAARKWRHLLDARPDVIAAANVGCIIQLRQTAPDAARGIPIVHPVELLPR
jgi:glycolate oxidase iron-sulfur subunit